MPTSLAIQIQPARDFNLQRLESQGQTSQGRILAVWILAPKLSKSDLKIAVGFWVDFFLLFFPRQKAEIIHQ